MTAGSRAWPRRRPHDDSHAKSDFYHGLLDDYAASLKAKGNTIAHVRQTIGRVGRVLDACKAQFWTDLHGSDVQQAIDGLKSSKGRCVNAQTKNYYLQAIKGLCKWAVRDGRLRESPVAYLRPIDSRKVRNDRRHERRALSVEEVTSLLKAASDGPDRHGMSGPERAMLYRLAVETGLRAGELQSLTTGSFDLDGSEPTVIVDGAYTKNAEPAAIPLRQGTAAALRMFLTGKMPSTRAFNMPKKEQRLRSLKSDLAAAGVQYRLDAQRGQVADFHSLRHTCGTWLAAAGVHPKVIQTVMRHLTSGITMDRYIHPFRQDEVAAVASLPELGSTGDESAAATGTDDHTGGALGAMLGATERSAVDHGRLKQTRNGPQATENPRQSGGIGRRAGFKIR